MRRTAAALALLLPAGLVRAQTPAIAITIDDLPAHGPLPGGTTRRQVAEEVVKALADAGAPPTYGFVNGIRLREDPADAAVLDLWRSSGNPLGNHTWSHMNLNEHTVAEFEADIEKNESVLAQRAGDTDWHWLRYPFVVEGDDPEKRTEVREYLAAHGYRIAAVTMSFGDYLWNEPYARCTAKGDQGAVTRLEESYLRAARDEAQYELKSRSATMGRTIPFVLLMHIGAFDARMLPRLLTEYKHMGFRLVSLESAERDPVYATDVDPARPTEPRAPRTNAAKPVLPQPPSPAKMLDALCR